MARALRYIPPNSLVEITARTIQARSLLRPSEELNRRFVGVVARAKRTYDVRVHALSCLSNHWHALVSARDALELARFMNYVQSNLAREAGDLHDWSGPFWGDRYHHVVVSREPEIQYRRLAYVLGQGAKEGLVARPELWPGVHSVFALRDGEPLRGVWYDRTGFCLAGRRKDNRGTLDDFASEEILELEPLPCWEEEGLSTEEMRAHVAEMVEAIAEEAAANHQAHGTRPSAPDVFLRLHPHRRPERSKRSPQPFVHAATEEVRERFREAYRIFSEAYRAAAERLRGGHRDVEFPKGSFPPSMPFIPLFDPG